MKHIHLNDCDSTQDYLKEQLKQGETSDVLISCENQIQGYGRSQKKWDNLSQSLFFSFTLLPHEKVTWTAIELAVTLTDYFAQKFGESLKLKWPNDIYDSEGKKCSGILVQQAQQKYIAGIGINLVKSENWGGVFSDEKYSFTKKEWCADLHDYIQNHRIPETDEIKKRWSERCIHMNLPVVVSEGSESIMGKFVGLGEWGEAVLDENGKPHHIYNGSLRW